MPPKCIHIHPFPKALNPLKLFKPHWWRNIFLVSLQVCHIWFLAYTFWRPFNTRNEVDATRYSFCYCECARPCYDLTNYRINGQPIPWISPKCISFGNNSKVRTHFFQWKISIQKNDGKKLNDALNKKKRWINTTDRWFQYSDENIDFILNYMFSFCMFHTFVSHTLFMFRFYFVVVSEILNTRHWEPGHRWKECSVALQKKIIACSAYL